MSLILGCKNTTEPIEDILFIRLDKSSYIYDETAVLTIENSLGFDLKLLGCGSQPGFDIEKEIDGIFQKPYEITCAGGFPYFIVNGETFEHEINLAIFPRYLDEIEGTYRLNLWLQKLQNDIHVFLSDSLRTTKSFSVSAG